MTISLRNILLLLLMIFFLAGCPNRGVDDTSSTDNNNNPVQTELRTIDIDEFQSEVENFIDSDDIDGALTLLKSVNLKDMALSSDLSNTNQPQYWGVMGYDVIMPGLTALPLEHKVNLQSKLWMIPGTSDVITGSKEQAWNHAAFQAAEKYNRYLYQEYNESIDISNR